MKKELLCNTFPNSRVTSFVSLEDMYVVSDRSYIRFALESRQFVWMFDSVTECSFTMSRKWHFTHYFIPAETMFDRHIHGDTKQRLHQVLQHLISADFRCLVTIKTDDIGRLLEFHCVPYVTAAAKLEYNRDGDKKNQLKKIATCVKNYRQYYPIQQSIRSRLTKREKR